jgi:hypothetical protein
MQVAHLPGSLKSFRWLSGGLYQDDDYRIQLIPAKNYGVAFAAYSNIAFVV